MNLYLFYTLQWVDSENGVIREYRLAVLAQDESSAWKLAKERGIRFDGCESTISADHNGLVFEIED